MNKLHNPPDQSSDVTHIEVSFGQINRADKTNPWVWIAFSNTTKAHLVSQPFSEYQAMLNDFVNNGIPLVEKRAISSTY